MRNILVLLLIGGIAFLGYEFGRRRTDGVEAKTKANADAKADGKGEKKAPGKGGVSALRLDPSGLERKVEVVPDNRVEFADTSTAEAAARYVKALEKRDFGELQPAAELRDSFPLGSTARFALEVALARGEEADSIDPDASAALFEASAGLTKANSAASSAAEARSHLVSGFVSLVEAGHLGRAIAAVSYRNEFLSGRGGAAAARAWIEAAKALEPDAHALYLSALIDALTRGGVAVWRDRDGYALLKDAYLPLQGVLRKVLFNAGGTWKSRHYQVKRGESLTGIASTVIRNWGIPMSPGLLMKINGISSAKSMRANTRLRIPTERMHAVVEKSTFSMKVFIGNVLVRLYEVGLGEDDSTPETVFTVSERQLDPQWTNPRTGETYSARHPKNLIGRYFVRLEDGQHSGFGIHGTKDQSSIGKNSSMGCIRLRQRDIEDVFSYIPTDTRVVIRR